MIRVFSIKFREPPSAYDHHVQEYWGRFVDIEPEDYEWLIPLGLTKRVEIGGIAMGQYFWPPDYGFDGDRRIYQVVTADVRAILQPTRMLHILDVTCSRKDPEDDSGDQDKPRLLGHGAAGQPVAGRG